MPETLKLALAQLNPVMGDIAGNLARLKTVRQQAADQGADLLMTTELYLSAYPPEDLVMKPAFMAAIEQAVNELALATGDGGPAILLGTPWREQGKLFNTCLLLQDGKIAAKTFKRDLPNYGPFDEKRVFAAGLLPEPLLFKNVRLGVMVCEDMWTPDSAAHLKRQGAQILLSPNGSPYETGKLDVRKTYAAKRAAETGLTLVYLNQYGGQDEVVYDGASFVIDEQNQLISKLKSFDEDFCIIDCSISEKVTISKVEHQNESLDKESADYSALLTGLRDYVVKNGFPGIVLGLSGGMDSALALILAVDGLGADKVWAVMLPSPYTSAESHIDAADLAKKLGCRYDIIPIEPAMQAINASLAPVFMDRPFDATEENIQSRSRGLILMALSNKFGHMVLSTGNKSEMAVGYATLYGDMCGGLAVLKDVYKTKVYQLARWRNAHKPATALGPDGIVIPENIFTKAPTAELKPGQTDQDSLPPYDVLDAILHGLIEEELGVDEIVARGHDRPTVVRIWSMLDRAEYKRRQSAPGIKITRRNFGRDRRYPITNKFQEK
jgi:NAD+ synthase